jgi:hypothetical protein
VLQEPIRDAEQTVWNALTKLTGWWDVFYSVRDRQRTSWVREADFVLVHDGLLLFVEVKGGHVDVNSPAQPNVRWNQYRRADWKHFGRAGKPVNTVAPEQLWNARQQILEALTRDLGHSPERLGFRCCQVFVFPHTSRAEIPCRENIDGSDQRFFFWEDMPDLAGRISAIAREPHFVAAQPARYWIGELCEAMWRNTLRPEFGATQASVSHDTTKAAAPLQSGRPLPPIQAVSPKLRLHPRYVWLSVACLLLAYLLWPSDEPAKAVQPKTTTQTSTALKPPEARPAPPAPAKSAVTTAAERPESALPTFIPKIALTDVEQAVMLARQKNESIPWQTGKHHGFVTLYDVEDGRCLRHRITRNDVNPVEVGFTRRC